jgi:dethiobiotin synthetase
MGEGGTQRSVRVAIVGTGTEVGKTQLAVALVHALARRGCSVAGLKPIESGVGAALSDGARLEAVGTFHVKHPAPYLFSDAVSPHLAARRAGLVISLARVTDWVAAHHAPWIVVETAGGLLSPLAAGSTNLDLVRALVPDAVLVVGCDRLGVLHEVGACTLALSLRAPELPAPEVLLQPPAVADGSTGTNAEELVALGVVRRVIALPRGDATSPEMEASLAPLVDRLIERSHEELPPSRGPGSRR